MVQPMGMSVLLTLVVGSLLLLLRMRPLLIVRARLDITTWLLRLEVVLLRLMGGTGATTSTEESSSPDSIGTHI